MAFFVAVSFQEGRASVSANACVEVITAITTKIWESDTIFQMSLRENSVDRTNIDVSCRNRSECAVTRAHCKIRLLALQAGLCGNTPKTG
jgi:hypothetical protein